MESPTQRRRYLKLNRAANADDDDLIPRIRSDLDDGKARPEEKQENQGTDGDAKEASGLGGSDAQPTSDNQKTGEEGQANKEDQPHNEEGDGTDVGGSVPVKSGQSSSRRALPANTTKPEPNDSPLNSTPRRRGRPSKKDAIASNVAKASPIKRKRDAAGSGLRRSSRAAAESATQQITEQSKKRSAASVTPVTPSLKKPAVSSRSKGKKIATKEPKAPEYEVELIMATRKAAGVTQYLVKWKDFPIRDSTWEPAANLTHCAKALEEFRET